MGSGQHGNDARDGADDGRPADRPDSGMLSGTHSELSGSADHVVQARDVSGGVHFHYDRPPGAPSPPGRPSPGSSPPPRQLPGDIRCFVNRRSELRRLDAILTDGHSEPLVLSICVIAGTAGVGKTSLALHWAHQAHRHFPDGQLYANLRGYDPGDPVTAAEALHGFLRALDVPAKAVPADLQARATLFRSLLAGRRMLVILDNAATVGQIRPVLPGTAGCLVIVTSRSRLSGLVAREGAHRVTIGTLTETEAVALLRTVTAGYRPEDDSEQLAELARLCARLPLALRIAAERAASRPRMDLEDLIADLRDESALWDALSAGDDEEADAIATVFAWSYRALPQEAARAFRFLGLHPGSGFSASAAAALIGTGTSRVRQLLDTLVGAHLLEQTGPDRYEFHDLLRAYATDQARHEESAEARAAALRRVLDWYLHSADQAQTWINPREAHIPLDPLGDGVTAMTFPDHTAAMNWFEAEHANLLAATRAAEHAELHRTAWQIPAVVRSIHMILNPFEEWLAMSHIGLRAARRAGDRTGEVEVLESLGMAYTQSHRLHEGEDHHTAALSLRRVLGDRKGEALSLNDIGLIHLRSRRLRQARDQFEQAMALFRELGEAAWEAVSSANLAEVLCELERYPEASERVRCALVAYRADGDEGGEGNALRILGAIQCGRGRYQDAKESVERALEIAYRHQNRMWEAYWLLELGSVQLASGIPGSALESYQRTAALHRRLGDRSREAKAWDGAGRAYTALGRHDEAVDFHRGAASAHRELGDGWRLAVSLDHLATALRQQQEEVPEDAPGDAPRNASPEQVPEEARRHWTEALLLIAAFDDPRAERMRTRISSETGPV